MFLILMASPAPWQNWQTTHFQWLASEKAVRGSDILDWYHRLGFKAKCAQLPVSALPLQE